MKQSKIIDTTETYHKLTVMDANDRGALQLVLFNKRMMTQHKSKLIGPFAEGSRDL